MGVDTHTFMFTFRYLNLHMDWRTTQTIAVSWYVSTLQQSNSPSVDCEANIRYVSIFVGWDTVQFAFVFPVKLFSIERRPIIFLRFLIVDNVRPWRL